MNNIMITGVYGKMGEVLETLVNEKYKEKVEIILGYDIKDIKDKKYNVFTNAEELKKEIISKYEKNISINGLIDFSIPKCTIEILNVLKQLKEEKEIIIPIIIATTGFNQEEENQILEYSKSIPVFKSANMSFGIAVMKKAIQDIYQKYNFDIELEILEKHHRRKIDAPSGTAKLLADSLKEKNKDLKYVYDRESVRKPKEKNELGIFSIRGGNIVGEHTVFFLDDDEILEITHKAESRAIFANGAIKAMIYMQGKKSGIYSIEDMMKN